MTLIKSSFILRSAPWLLALIYLTAIGMLGWQFHLQRDYKVSELTELLADGQKRPTHLGILRSVKTDIEQYTFEYLFEPHSEQPMALFLPRYSSDVDIHLNNVLIRRHAITYSASHAYLPSLILLPTELLKPSDNQLKITLIGYNRTASLSQFYLGPQQQIEPLFKRFHFWRVPLMQWAWVITVIVALFMGTIWLTRRQLSEYGWIALAFASITIYLESFIRTSEPAFPYIYHWLFFAARAVFIVAFIIFTHQILKLKRRRLEQLITGLFVLIFMIGFGLVISGQFNNFVNLELLTSTPLTLALLGYIGWCLWAAIRRENKTYLHWFLVSSLCALILGLHDVLVVLNIQHPLVRDFYLSQYAILFTIIGYGGVMVHRIAAALLNSEELNTELTRQVNKKTQELQAAAENKLMQDKQLLLYAERQRIMADMHDGVGGQLVNLLAANRGDTLSQDEISRELDLILADLRLVLDALTPSGEELVAALARLKERYTSLLKHANIELHWDVDFDIEAIPMPPSLTINILRLIQEAVQNSIKHSGADNIWLKLIATNDGYSLSIVDDGIGIANAKPGHGTKTMQQRALTVNGKLHITQPAAGGTEITLTFPAPAST